LGPHRVGLPALRFGRDGARLKAASGAARPLPERKVLEGCCGSPIGGRQRCRRSAAAEFLANQRIAVTGVSRNPQGHGSNLVYQRLRERGYQVVAVNPNAEQLEGDRCYPDLRSIPGGVEAVVIGTRPEIAETTMRECAELGIKCVWMHRGPALAAFPMRPPSTAGRRASG
jgi:predicted CoA-binding protein